MSVYRFTIRVSSDKLLLAIHRFLMLRASVLMVETLPDAFLSDAGSQPPTEAEAPTWARSDGKAERNREIIAKYEADSVANSCGNLAVEYGLTRERICQILRIPNVIAKAKERRAAVRGAYDDVRAELSEKVKVEFNERIARGLELVRSGQSVRQACMTLGLTPHSTFSNLLGEAARAAGLRQHYGRHRDFSQRRQRVSELSAQGFSVEKIVKTMRDEGSDPHIHEAWVYNNMPETKIKTAATETEERSHAEESAEPD